MRQTLIAYLCASLAVITTPSLAFAEECTKPIPLTTPCSGVLLPPSAAEEGLRCLKITVPSLKLELKYQKELFDSQKVYYDLVLNAEKQRSTDLSKQVDLLLAKPVQGKSVFDSPVFWTVVGVVIGAGATIGIAYSLPRN